MSTTSAIQSADQTSSIATRLQPIVVDEAFADLPDLEVRVDEAQTSMDYVEQTERLVATIGQQLKAIEQQRGRLVRLLSDLGI